MKRFQGVDVMKKDTQGKAKSKTFFGVSPFIILHSLFLALLFSCFFAPFFSIIPLPLMIERKEPYKAYKTYKKSLSRLQP